MNQAIERSGCRTGSSGLAAQGVLLLLQVYKSSVSPWIMPACRFEPSCSHYAMTAIERHGLVRGGWLAVRRLGRCHPFDEGGFDPVP